MAGLTKRVYVTAGIILLSGIFIQLAGKATATGKDEKYMIDRAPAEVDGYVFTAGNGLVGKSSEAKARDYELLRPFGIVPRVYLKGDKGYEVLLISSNTKESFHDQRVCFPGQGMTPLSSEIVELNAGDRGTIPVVLATYQTDFGKATSAYFYRGPNGYRSYPQQLAKDLLFSALMGKQDLDSNYYRFMPKHADVSKEEILDFIKKYLDVAGKTSKGFF